MLEEHLNFQGSKPFLTVVLSNTSSHPTGLYKSDVSDEGGFHVALLEMLRLAKGIVKGDSDSYALYVTWNLQDRPANQPSAEPLRSRIRGSDEGDTNTSQSTPQNPDGDSPNRCIGQRLIPETPTAAASFNRHPTAEDQLGKDDDVVFDGSQAKSDSTDFSDADNDSTVSEEDRNEEDDNVVFVKSQAKSDKAIKSANNETSDGVEDLLETKDKTTDWHEACNYFNHDPKRDTIAPEDCHKLPGTKRLLRPHQLQDIHRLFKLATSDIGDLGGLLAHQMGVGKTITYQAVTAVRRLAIISYAHFKKDRDLHASASGHCGLLATPFGIQCACETDGLTAKIVAKYGRGGTMVATPSSIANQAVKDAGAFFEPVVTFSIRHEAGSAPPSKCTVQFIIVTDFRAASPDRNALNALAADFHFTHDDVHDLPASTKTSQMYTDRRAQGLLNKAHVEVSLIPTRNTQVSPSAVVLITTRERLSRDNTWRDKWTAEMELDVTGGRKATIKYAGMYFFGLIVWDEAHQVRKWDTNLAKVLYEMLSRPKQHHA
ncbi:hypothetical protein CABS02_13384 [Colletotrichum abscissum]|uniref:SNF2 N-terminal domain-containing protein n=1 Tax=Colletotrichum abscissum TaxID=1671311 RepID=A0A9P9X309_9PEZI|nr:hypothetical protein CABS02_13384 [Colletotrichum abscissum]